MNPLRVIKDDKELYNYYRDSLRERSRVAISIQGASDEHRIQTEKAADRNHHVRFLLWECSSSMWAVLFASVYRQASRAPRLHWTACQERLLQGRPLSTWPSSWRLIIFGEGC